MQVHCNMTFSPISNICYIEHNSTCNLIAVTYGNNGNILRMNICKTLRGKKKANGQEDNDDNIVLLAS